ncbi:MAG: electron transfer flavoprotein subunit beta/FixA family protein [Ignavibacteriaceae bacterium]|nr:electron transfer flavoprotein subunit beta/FixA family protein [Ignavibacteriaceae bacterium]
MKIAVCVNHVPDTATKIKVGPDGKKIDTIGVTYIVNPYDEYAIEEGLKLKEKISGTVYVIGLGGDSHKESLKKALAMGADEGILLKTDQDFDSVTVAKLLAEEIKSLGCEVVFTGKQSIDFDNSATGQMISEFLGFNCVSNVVSLTIENGSLEAEREIEGGREVVKTTFPAVITAQKGINEPRYASLKGIMAAKKKVITEKSVAQSTSKTKSLGLRLPAPKNPGRILGSDAEAIKELVKLLREEAKVI